MSGSLEVLDPHADRSDQSQGDFHFEGVWIEEVSQRTRSVSDFRPIPVDLVGRYAEQAARSGVVSQLKDGSWYAEIPEFKGVWAAGEYASDALEALADVVFDWTILKMLDRDLDIPVVGDMDLRVA